MAAAAPALRKPTEALTPFQRAERLGTIYNYLKGNGGLPLDKWAKPELRSDNAPFLAALAYAYMVDERGQRNIGRSVVADRTVPYRADYDAVIPAIRTAALAYATDALNKEENELTTLLTKLERDPQEPERLQAVARQIGAKVKLEPSIGELARMFEGKVDSDAWHRAKRKEVARAVRTVLRTDLTTLFAHPDGVAIVAAYVKSPEKGTELAASHVQRSVDALRDFRREINATPQNIWRYPFFVVGGAKLLALDEIPGFKEFLISLSRVLAEGKWDEVVNFASMAVACLGLVFTGPVGAAVLGVADLALSGAQTALAYVRERERELAGTAAEFRAAGDEFAIRGGYRDTVLSGAASLLSAIALYKSTRELRNLLKPRLVPPEFATAPRSPLTGESRGKRLSAPALEPSAGARGTRSTEGPKARGAARERSGAAQAQEGAAEAVEATSAAARGGPRDLVAGGDAEAELVSLGPLPNGLADNLEKQIANLQLESAAEQAAKDRIQSELRDIAVKVDSARLLGRTQTEEYRALLIRRAELVAKQEEFGVASLNLTIQAKKEKLRALLRVNEQGYFKDLTNAARARPEYVAVATGAIDGEVFLVRPWSTQVDHLYPRIEIWNTPGFKENLTRDQQVFLFAYSKNLKRTPWPLNSRRGARRYRDLPPHVWREHVVDEEALLRLDRDALSMRDEITKLIKNPGNPNLWRDHGFRPRP